MSTGFETDPSESDGEVRSMRMPSSPSSLPSEDVDRYVNKGKAKIEEATGSRPVPMGPGMARIRARNEEFKRLQRENASLMEDVVIGRSVIKDLNEKWQELDVKVCERENWIRLEKRFSCALKEERANVVNALNEERARHGVTRQRNVALKAKHIALKEKFKVYKAKVQAQLDEVRDRAQQAVGQVHDDVLDVQAELHSADEMSDASEGSVELWW